MRTARGSVGDGGEVTILSLAGYDVVLTADSASGCDLVLRNISAGANGNAEAEWTAGNNDFDEGAEVFIAREGLGEGTEVGDDFYAHNATTSIQGAGAVTREGDFGTGPACTATVRAFTP